MIRFYPAEIKNIWHNAGAIIRPQPDTALMVQTLEFVAKNCTTDPTARSALKIAGASLSAITSKPSFL